jgi:tetratricopeptide (TPR) repeat protein
VAKGRLRFRAVAPATALVGERTRSGGGASTDQRKSSSSGSRAKGSDTKLRDAIYDLDFALGRAALAQSNLELARRHFEQLYARFHSSAIARYALGDLLLWQDKEPEKAHQLLEGALAGSSRSSLPFWTRLGLEAELRASYAWSLGRLNKPDEGQHCIVEAIKLAGKNQPVQAAVHLRLGCALSALQHPNTAREHWYAAAQIDPRVGLGNRLNGNWHLRAAPEVDHGGLEFLGPVYLGEVSIEGSERQMSGSPG